MMWGKSGQPRNTLWPQKDENERMLKPRVLYKAFTAFQRKLCMREMQCVVHTVLSVQMKLKHFVLVLFVTMLLSPNAINSYFINLFSFVLA